MDLDQEIQTLSICGPENKPSTMSDLSPGYALLCRCHSVGTQWFSGAKVVQNSAIKVGMDGGKREKSKEGRCKIATNQENQTFNHKTLQEIEIPETKSLVV